MITTAQFLQFSQWSALISLGFAVLAAIGFALQWGVRFRLVGVTGFMIVLTGGLFALSLVPFTRTVIPGAVRFGVVYDNGGTQAVIAVDPTVTESQLHATLEQAANNLFSPGRSGSQAPVLTIRARTILHPQEGVSEPVYLGTVHRSLLVREDPTMTIEINGDQIARLSQFGSNS